MLEDKLYVQGRKVDLEWIRRAFFTRRKGKREEKRVNFGVYL